ncbi:hypothetical protein [Sulfitobacter aestuariivivens]|uniref:hypothetical protein n=1 Tax=Sulfitobacter aestuariivivens TaxID=2766981 RepID=UPI0031B5A64C
MSMRYLYASNTPGIRDNLQRNGRAAPALFFGGLRDFPQQSVLDQLGCQRGRGTWTDAQRTADIGTCGMPMRANIFEDALPERLA